jgi:hypothetical protein
MADFSEDDIAQFITEQRARGLKDRLDNLNKVDRSNFGYRNEYINVGGSRTKGQDFNAVGGRAGVNIPVGRSARLEAGLSGHYAKGKGFKDAGLDQADVTLAKQFENNSELRGKLRKNIGDSIGEEFIGAEYEIPFKKGGSVKAKPKNKAKPKVSKASSRADGCAQRGKTRGKLR